MEDRIPFLFFGGKSNKMKKENKLERIVEFSPAYDKRSESGGIGGVEIRFALKGKKGAVHFVFGTGWTIESQAKGIPKSYPTAWNIGYHRPTPNFEGELPFDKSCPYLDGKPCYYTWSDTKADIMLEMLISEGSEGVWKQLEKEYEAVFEEE